MSLPKYPCSLLFFLVLAAASACSGGFYRVNMQPDWTGESEAGVTQVSYIRVSVDIHNEQLLNSPVLAADRDGDLVYLHVSAEFQHPSLGATNIPLYSINLSDASIHSVSGANLVDMIPVARDARGNSLMTIRTRALSEGLVDRFLETLNLSDPLLQSLGATGIPTGQVSTAISTVSGILNSFAADEFRYQFDLSIPAGFARQQGYRVHFLYPTDRDGNALPIAARQMRDAQTRPMKICENSARSFLCDKETGSAFLSLPYLLLRFQLLDYVNDPLLMPQAISSSCAEITTDLSRRVSSRVDIEGILVPDQRAAELDLLARANALLSLRAAHSANDLKGAANALVNAMLLPSPTSAMWGGRYKERADKLSACIAAVQFPGSVPIAAAMQVGSGSATTAHALNKALGQLRVIVSLSNADDYKFLRGSRALEIASSRKTEMETFAYDSLLAADVHSLSKAQTKTAASDATASRLETAVRELSLCDMCQDRVQAALSTYRSRALQAELSRRSEEETRLLSAVDALRVQLAAAEIAAKSASDELRAERLRVTSAALAADSERLRDAVASPVTGSLMEDIRDRLRDAQPLLESQ